MPDGFSFVNHGWARRSTDYRAHFTGDSIAPEKIE
jgi:hypothetical protein